MNIRLFVLKELNKNSKPPPTTALAVRWYFGLDEANNFRMVL
ncbi:MAG: hypothetical protein OT643_10715 [Bacteroidetes bacterium]|nr:hypothetical protein [Bacteroidota bacterium]HMS51208.1 hypothetical protein [Chitinophagales bacterium]